jgi:hypothetical protein
MSIGEMLIRKDKVTQHKSLAPLAWLLVFVGVLFLGAGGFAAYRLVTRNVNPLGFSAAPPEPTSVGAISSATPTIAVSRGVTWTVDIVQNQLGVTVAQVPPQVATKALGDYLGAIQWWDSHLYDLNYLRGHAAEYFTGEQLEFLLGLLDWEASTSTVIPMGQDPLLPPGHQIQFAADGAHAFVMDYLAAGESPQYDLKTKARKPGTSYSSRVAVTELSYDASAQRWKIMHGVALIDLQTHQIIWQAQ